MTPSHTKLDLLPSELWDLIDSYYEPSPYNAYFVQEREIFLIEDFTRQLIMITNNLSRPQYISILYKLDISSFQKFTLVPIPIQKKQVDFLYTYEFRERIASPI